MPINNVDDAMAMKDLELIQATLAEIPRSPRHTMLKSVLELRWSMKNQENAEEASKFTNELVNQTKILAIQTASLASQTKNLMIATWG